MTHLQPAIRHRRAPRRCGCEKPSRLFALVVTLILALLPCASLHAQRGNRSLNDELLRKLQIAELAISELYVDSVDQPKLVEDAIRGMLEKLDPHSSYSTAKETKAMNESLGGSFEGIGIQFNVQTTRSSSSSPSLADRRSGWAFWLATASWPSTTRPSPV